MIDLLFGMAAAAVAWGVRWAFAPVVEDHSPYITVVMAAAVVTTYRGFTTGLVTTLVAGLAANFSFVGRPDTFELSGRHRSEFLFLIIACGVVLFCIDAAIRQRRALAMVEGPRAVPKALERLGSRTTSPTVDRLLDLGLSVFSLLFAPVLYVMARKRWRLRATRSVHDQIGITIVRNHYYEPVFTDADLTLSSDDVRALPGVDFDIEGQVGSLDRFHFADELASLDGSAVNGHVYYYSNQMFGEGDADALYSFVRAYKPATVIEVGCGHSSIVTELALRKNRAEQPGRDTRHICLEPFHNQWLDGIGVDFRAERVEDVDLRLFADLKPNDIVFIDSSHVLRSQGDVEHIFLRVLPILPVGVIVHFHDIFTPFDYSHKFLREERRFWTEQYMLESFLTCNNDFRVLLAMNYLHASREPKLYAAFPILAARPSANPGSLWIQRIADSKDAKI